MKHGREIEHVVLFVFLRQILHLISNCTHLAVRTPISVISKVPSLFYGIVSVLMLTWSQEKVDRYSS